MSKNSTLVYSTDSSKQKCGDCGEYDCVCDQNEEKPLSQQSARIFVDRKGRKGKSVTVIDGLSVNPQHLNDIAKQLKQFCGTGGTAKQGKIEIQGEQLEKVQKKLNDLGVNTKLIKN